MAHASNIADCSDGRGASWSARHAVSQHPWRRRAPKDRGEYAKVVERLIEGGRWDEMPPFEDQLPDESMPPAFFEFWANPEPTATLRLAPPIIPSDQERLGQLAFQYRGTRRADERQRIASEYADVVDRLIKSGCWNEAPASEDQLPDDRMPRAFFDFWLCPQPDP